MADLSPLPVPTSDAIAEAAHQLTKMSECKPLDGWVATFRRINLACTGVWPADYDYGSLFEISVPVEEIPTDFVDQGSWDRHLQRSELAIRQGVERFDLELELMREALGEGE